MKKYLLKILVKKFANPLFDIITDALSKLADRTQTQIDNRMVKEVIKNKRFIINYILDNIKSI